MRLPPPIIGAICALAMWFCRNISPTMNLPEGIALMLAGIIGLIGVLIDLMALVHFLNQRTTINPLRPERTSALVLQGVYRYTRNPMYLGMVLVLLAWGIYLEALISFAFPVIFIGIINRYQIPSEERALFQIFGEDYQRYCQQVRRWI